MVSCVEMLIDVDDDGPIGCLSTSVDDQVEVVVGKFLAMDG